MQIRQIHRYISLVFAALWLFQALTGCLIVFRWELDDATVRGHHAVLDTQAMGARLDALVAQPKTQVSSVWSANDAADRFDISYTQDGHDRTLRVDGTGHALRDRSNDTLGDGNIYDHLSDLHMALMLGDSGRWFLGVSGLLLISNMALGLKLAWPRVGQWLKMLSMPKGKAAPALLYGWHRMLGLWLCVPAFITITAGVLLAFDDPLTTLFKADVPQPVPMYVAAGPDIAPSRALSVAMNAFPKATLSGFDLPDSDTPWYKVRLRVQGEIPRIWGMTTIFISARNGTVLSAYDARARHAPMRFVMDLIYPLHTGQIGGVLGRCVQLLTGLWLVTMIGLGVTLWWKRRRR